jgi:hypothetical protein
VDRVVFCRDDQVEVVRGELLGELEPDTAGRARDNGEAPRRATTSIGAS